MGRDHSEDLGLDGRITLKLIKEWNGNVWTGLFWLRTGTGGWALSNTIINLRVLLNVGNFLLAEDLLASQEGLCYMELFSKWCICVSVPPVRFSPKWRD
jgi:hypothetical protein